MFTIIETPENTYYGEPRSNESKYYGKVYYKNGWSYQGYLMNGKKNGYGEMTTINGSYSKGYYSDDLLNGKAIVYDKEKGTYIDGYYVDGLLNGECLFYNDLNILTNKNWYKDGKSCVAVQETIYKTINGEKVKVYDGYIFDDVYNGFGKLYENNKVYIGNFTSGKKDGKFLICYPNGHLAYTSQSNIDLVVDIDKLTKETFNNYKNTVNFNNDTYDDNNKIVQKDIDHSIKYVGKLNSSMNYNDDTGTYYTDANKYTGKFVDGTFISGSYIFKGGKYKGEFTNFLLNGNGVVEFDNGSKFTGIFTNNLSDFNTLIFKENNIENEIKCQINISNDSVVFNTIPETVYKKDANNKYVGNITLFMSLIEGMKIVFKSGKHYIDNNLVYEGDFKEWVYHGHGIKYHPNGNLHITGTFNGGESIKSEYYDESGNLIYADTDEFTDLPGLEEVLPMLPSVPQLINNPGVFTAMLNNLVHSVENLGNVQIDFSQSLNNEVPGGESDEDS